MLGPLVTPDWVKKGNPLWRSLRKDRDRGRTRESRSVTSGGGATLQRREGLEHQECVLIPVMLFVLPEVLTLVLRPSFVLFSQAFPFLVF